jgi:hypothetical protein
MARFYIMDLEEADARDKATVKMLPGYAIHASNNCPYTINLLRVKTDVKTEKRP